LYSLKDWPSIIETDPSQGEIARFYQFILLVSRI
jgi:hypothetical protein